MTAQPCALPEGTLRGDPANRRTSDYLAGVTHRFALSKERLSSAGDPVVRMYLPTLREAVDLMRACRICVSPRTGSEGR